MGNQIILFNLHAYTYFHTFPGLVRTCFDLAKTDRSLLTTPALLNLHGPSSLIVNHILDHQKDSPTSLGDRDDITTVEKGVHISIPFSDLRNPVPF